MSSSEKHVHRLEVLRQAVNIITGYIQYLFAAIIIIGIILQLTSLPGCFSKLLLREGEGFHEFLEFIIDMVIGIELIHLLCRPNLDNVVEVLLIAITREIVLTEPGPISTLAGVVSIALLFAVRKFLFIQKLDSHDEDFDKNPDD